METLSILARQHSEVRSQGNFVVNAPLIKADCSYCLISSLVDFPETHSSFQRKNSVFPTQKYYTLKHATDRSFVSSFHLIRSPFFNFMHAASVATKTAAARTPPDGN